MKKIAVLGPEGTYSDIAAKKYLEGMETRKIEYYPSILKTAQAVSSDTIAILPFENTLDGFVLESMDQIISHNFHIISQLKLDIDFAFVSNASCMEEVKNCYVQFKAHGQCLDFLSRYGFSVIITQSNTESLSRVLQSDASYGAIVPIHTLKDNPFQITILHIADSSSNETRFFIVSSEPAEKSLKEYAEASVVITTRVDRPGILYDILKNFHDLSINLKSIMSRPMKTEMGKYRFYVECSLMKKDVEALDILVNRFEHQNNFTVKVLGIYNRL